jgi:hypothetical protein
MELVKPQKEIVEMITIVGLMKYVRIEYAVTGVDLIVIAKRGRNA